MSRTGQLIIGVAVVGAFLVALIPILLERARPPDQKTGQKFTLNHIVLAICVGIVWGLIIKTFGGGSPE